MKKLLQKAGIILMACIMTLTGLIPAAAAEKTGLYEGQPARFSYGSSLKTDGGETYQFTGRDLNWMQMYCYNYQTGQPYVGGARELAGPLERYRIKTSEGSFVGYCIEHGVMVDEALQLQAADYRNAVITEGLGEEVMQNIKLCLFYGRQNGDSISNLLDSPEQGGLGFADSEFYGRNASAYTLDDWEIATVMLIRESQQKFRDSRFRLKSGGNGLSYTNGWRGPETGKINTDHYVKPLKGKAAYDIYKYMEQLCQDHFLFSSSIASMNPDTPKNIAFGAEDRDAAGNYYKKVSVSASRACPLKAVDKDNPAIEAEGVSVNLLEEGGKFYYEITVAEDAFTEGAIFGLCKVMPGRVPANDLLVWECATTNGHLQAITTGMADPLQGYFSLSTKADPLQGEPPEPDYFPVFEFPVSKEDFNPGWDNSVNTPMGDAALSATYVLYRDGTEVDRVTLDDYGRTEVLSDQPWTSSDDLVRAESGETETHMVEAEGEPPEMVDHGCGTIAPTKVEWSGNCTYTIAEITPEGRFTEPDAYGGVREYMAEYYAVTEDERQYACETPVWKNIEYTVNYHTVTGSGSGGNSGPETSDNLEDILVFGEETFVNDCYRGKITLSKSLEREDVFKDNPMGGHPESINSKWQLSLVSGGYEGQPYVRFVREANLADGTAVYRVVRDGSGISNAAEVMTVGNNGDLVIYDIPYGTYYMEEVSADDASFVREKFVVEIGEHGGTYTTGNDYDNRYDYNVRDKKITNRIKICKTDAETGKGVDLAGTKFHIRYKGSPLNTDAENEALENYNRYLPDAAEITADGPYTFEADENGELVVRYQLPYGIYEITEWQVPEGYYTEEDGNVYTFIVSQQELHTDGNFGQLVTYDGNITAADPLYDSSRYPYTAYYQAVKMANNQVKGRITVKKTGQILTDYLEEKILGHKIYRPVYEMAAGLKGAIFGIFAAEDIMLSDGNDGPAVFDALTDEELVIPVEKSTHYGSTDIMEEGRLHHSSGAELHYYRDRESGSAGAEGEDNHYTMMYISPEQKDTSYSYTFITADGTSEYTYDVEVNMNFQAGGRNMTDVKIIKTTCPAENAVQSIPLTKPAGYVEDEGIQVGLNPLVSYICGDEAPDGQRRSNALSVYEKTDIETDSEGMQTKAVQAYEISFVQEAGNSNGFSMNWDGFEIAARADCMTKTAETVIKSQGSVPVINCGIGYTYVIDSEEHVSTFTASEPASPVYFLSGDGIRTEMYYFGGYMKAKMEIPQSAVDKDFDRIIPDMGFDWYSKLTPSSPVITYEPVRGTKVTAARHENSDTGQAESYTVEIISNQTSDEPFTVAFADGYTMSFFTDTADSGNGVGVILLDGIYKTTRYTLSELVETIETGVNGQAISSALPLGRYIVRELKAPDGYVLSSREYEAELKYKDQYTPVVWAETSASNSQVPVEIDLTKVFETGYRSGQFVPGKGAVFGIFTADGKNRLLDIFSAGPDGRTLRKVKLPLGHTYYVRELQTSGSYELCSTPFYFRADDVTTEAPSFDYGSDGISGRIVMESSGVAEITVNTLARFPQGCITVNDKVYQLDISSEEGMVVNKVFSDRAVTTVRVTEGTPVSIILGNGKNISVNITGNSLDYVIDDTIGTYIPEVSFTGFFAAYSHEWTAPEESTQPATEDIVFKGAGTQPVVIEAEVLHTPFMDSVNVKYEHMAVLSSAGEKIEIDEGQTHIFTDDAGTETEVLLNEAGGIRIVQKGIIKGSVSETDEPEVTKNNEKDENVKFYKSVTFARTGSGADTIQVKINTADNINAGTICNLHKEIPSDEPEPEIPDLPEIPDTEVIPEEPQQLQPESEQEEPHEEPQIVTTVPETGVSASGYLWFLMMITSLISIVLLILKKEKEN